MVEERTTDVTVNDVARVTGATLSGDENVFVSDVTHDSRQAKEGSLFAAVRGELFDAHKFVPKVMEQGAAGVISEQQTTKRFHTAWAALTEICWPQIARARVMNASPRRTMNTFGCARMIAAITGSRRASERRARSQ